MPPLQRTPPLLFRTLIRTPAHRRIAVSRTHFYCERKFQDLLTDDSTENHNATSTVANSRLNSDAIYPSGVQNMRGVGASMRSGEAVVFFRSLGAKEIRDLRAAIDSEDLRIISKTVKELAQQVDGGRAPNLDFGVFATPLEAPLSNILEQLMADNGQTAGLLVPGEFLACCRRLRLVRLSHYQTLLTWALREKRTPKELLPMFEDAVEFATRLIRRWSAHLEISAGEEEVDSELNAMRNIFTSAALQRELPMLLYFAYVSLVPHKDSLGSATLNQLADNLKPMYFPMQKDVQNFLDHSSALSHLREAHLQHLSNVPSYLKHLLNVVSANNPDSAQAVLSFYESAKSVRLTQMAYLAFITTLISHRHLSLAFQIWEEMVASGICPSPRSWNELLLSCKLNRDVVLLQKTWDRMINSGVLPDAVCWATRVHVLLHCGQIKSGLEFFSQMRESGVQITIWTINSIIDPLLKQGHLSESDKVLSIAAELGIKPDLVTYNTLLASRIRLKMFSEYTKLFGEMIGKGVCPDIVTYTTAIDGLYKYFPTKPSHRDVLKIIDQMEQGGIRGNVATYTSLISNLLREENDEAAREVRIIMEKKGIRSNSATYSTFIRRAFALRDLSRVVQIWNEIETRGFKVDYIVMAEMVIGHAKMGDIEGMNRAMRYLRWRGERLKLRDYMAVLKALGRNGEYEAAVEIVEEVIKRGLVGTKEDMGRSEREFLETVLDIGDGAVFKEVRRRGKVEI